METKILNSTKYQKSIFNEIKYEIEKIRIDLGKTPGIAFIASVGHVPLMKYTIALHNQAAKGLGFHTVLETLPHTASEEEYYEIIDKLNLDDEIHAIVLLQPVPKHINALRILERIIRDKEIEGFHPNNVIDTLTKGLYNTKYPMCLPVALIELFHNSGVKITSGKEYVFVADQDFITDPFRSLILKTASSQVIPEGCSYTIVNSDNKNLKAFCKRADFLFILSERPEFLPPEWLKQGVCIVDIYSNLVGEVPSKKDPNMMVPIIRGGVNTEAVLNIAGMIAPCPGGLMPILLGVLLRNALLAFKNLSVFQDELKYHDMTS